MNKLSLLILLLSGCFTQSALADAYTEGLAVLNSLTSSSSIEAFKEKHPNTKVIKPARLPGTVEVEHQNIRYLVSAKTSSSVKIKSQYFTEIKLTDKSGRNRKVNQNIAMKWLASVMQGKMGYRMYQTDDGNQGLSAVTDKPIDEVIITLGANWTGHMKRNK